MSRKFQCKAIPSTWLESNGRRLDCGPYMSGAAEIRELLKKHKTELLPSLTSGQEGGIYYGSRSSRNYVTSSEHGVPFLTTTFLMQADLTRLPLISRKDALSKKMVIQRVKEGMTLITRSGTVGRIVYSRPDMTGIWSNEDIIKLTSDPNKIRSGYLNAYLCTRFGVPFVVSGKYGSVISHLEPEHSSDLMVPRLADEIEQRAHDLVEEASNLLVKYQKNLNEATQLYFDSVGLRDITPSEWHTWGADLGFTAPAGIQSLRALNFNPRYQKITDKIKTTSWTTLGKICNPSSIKRGGRFLRIDGDPEFSYLMIGQKQIFWLRPEGRWIAKKFINKDLIVKPGTTLIAAVGTLEDSEKYCRSEFIWGKGAEKAYSEHFYQVLPKDDVMPSGCLFAFMRSETAFRMLRSISYGTKLQIQRSDFLCDLPIPYPKEKEIRDTIHKLVVEAYEAKDRAIELEDQARTLVEHAIEEGGH